MIDLATSYQELAANMNVMAKAELNKQLERNLTSFSGVQEKLNEITKQQAQKDILHLANTVDEYLRLIGSIKVGVSLRPRCGVV